MFNKSGFSIIRAGLIFSIFSYFLFDQPLVNIVLSQNNRPLWHLITEMGNSVWMAILILSVWLTAFGRQLANSTSQIHWGGRMISWKYMRRQAEFVFAAVAIPGIIILLIKGIVGRARPYMAEGGVYFDPLSFNSDFASWPSGHTTTAFAFAAVVGQIFPALRIPLFILAALTGYSRLALGVHYLGDVVMGATIGTAGAILVYNWLREKYNVPL